MYIAQDVNLTGGVVGGIIIGGTTTTLLYLTGRITGLSGIVEDSCLCNGGDNTFWTWFYSSGLVTSGLLMRFYLPSVFGSPQALACKDEFLILAGLAIGFGTRLGSGCTSGHGISGLPRMSPRSLAAVLTFMLSGSLTATLSRSNLMGPIIYRQNVEPQEGNLIQVFGPTIAVGCVTLAYSALKNGRFRLPSKFSAHTIMDGLISFGSALLFGLGLGVGGMLRSDRVHRFLDFSGSDGWDYSLLGVMGGGVAFNMISFYFLSRSETKPIMSQKSSGPLKTSIKYGLVPANLKIDSSLLVGAAMFGFGWGLSGICPGPAVVALGGQLSAAKVIVPSIVAGMAIQDLLMKPANPPTKSV